MLCKTVVILVIIVFINCHAAKRSEAGGILYRDNRGQATRGFLLVIATRQCKEDSFQKPEEEMDFGECETAPNSRFFFHRIFYSFLGSGFRLDAARLKIHFVFSERQT